MKKANRHEEIKRKEELQAKFRLALSQNQQKVRSWLIEGSHDSKEPSSHNEFYDLPVITNGAGLSHINKNPIRVGDFVNGEKKLKEISDASKPKEDTSKAMVALKKSIKKDTRKNRDFDNLRNKHQRRKENGGRFMKDTKDMKVNLSENIKKFNEDDSDSEDEIKKYLNRPKKGTNLLFESKLKR